MLIGFIGTGSMGSILIEALIRSGTVRSGDIIASNRTPEKAQLLANRFPGIRVAASNQEVASQSKLLFLCIKPLDYPAVIREIAASTNQHQIVVSITSPVMIKQLEERLPCKIVKIIPSITNYVQSGAALLIYGGRIQAEDRELLEDLLSAIARPIEVSEAYTRICSDLSSCGPAFMAYLIGRFADAAVKETGLPQKQAEQMATEMLLGTGMLLTSGGFTPNQLVKRVSVPGGITEEGLRLLDSEVGDTFSKLIHITHDKYAEDVKRTEAAFQQLEE